MSLQPLDDRIVVRPSEAEETRPHPVWSSLTPPKRSPSRARSSRSAPAGGPRTPAS